MKKIILVIVAAIGLATTTFAQITFQAGTQASIGLPSNNGVRALIDYNNDDFEDIIACDSLNNFKLYKNNGNGTFSLTNVGVNQKLNDGAFSALINCADFSNDGYSDFVITYRDSIKFFKNSTTGTFNDVTTSLGISNPITNRKLALNYSEGTGDSPNNGAWDDYDADGDLDFLIGTKDNTNSYIEVFINNGTSFNTRSILLTFALPLHPSFILMDFDNDQDQDILVLYFTNNNPPLAQYNYQPLKLYQKNGSNYTDITSSSGLGQASNHGFAKIWDYNNDGFADIIMGTTNSVFNGTHVNRVYKNNGNNTFSDVSTTLNLKNGNGYYRKVFPMDFDNDADIDVMYNSENHLFSNNGSGTFTTDQISSSGVSSSDDFTFIMDYDNNGKLDGMGYSLKPLRNTSSSSNNYIKIKLFGCPNLKDPRGTRVVLFSNSKKQTRYLLGANSGLDNTTPYSQILHFGLGTSTTIDSIKVYWANGGTSIIYSAVINSMNHIYQTSACLANSGSANCLATIYDTVTTHITVYDSVLVSVTDTLIINAIITGLTPPNNINIFKIFPNPTNDHITIDNGNIANLTGYQIKITNSLSQQVFQSAITQQQFYVDLSTWTGNGIYFVHIIDGQGNTIDIKKIVLQ